MAMKAATTTATLGGGGGGGRTLLSMEIPPAVIPRLPTRSSILRPSPFIIHPSSFSSSARPNQHQLRLLIVNRAVDSTQPSSSPSAVVNSNNKTIVTDNEFTLAKVYSHLSSQVDFEFLDNL
ncbi:hypothetical protein BVC80_9073g21 [Macleaya cordata]|uniref:Uncharacterized protein n=1 Tax=Macleaya cordata TaxID=56857 RepID=A0A200PTR0_MACCD|nr:hypothetical protein BVC80_9073g21 [Macleaya cordata]